MLNTKVGNCYGFASTLAAFAKELGYKKIELIDGRTPGTRDHAPDGFQGCMDIVLIRSGIMLKRFIISGNKVWAKNNLG